MNTIKLRLASYRDVAMIFFVAAIFVLAVAYSVFSATTISDNVNTGGTLTVSGASTLGHVYASSTVQSTGNVFAYASLGIGTTTTGTRLGVNAGTTLLAGDVYIYGKAMLPYLQATSTTASYFTGVLGIGTTTPGTQLAVNAGTTLLAGDAYIYGKVMLPYLQATSTTASYFIGSIGIGTTTPGTTLSVTGSGVVNDVLTVGGVLKATSTVLLAVDGGNVGIATSTPGTTLAVRAGAQTLLGGPTTIYGQVILPYFQATSTTNSYLLGSFGVGTTTPGAKLSVTGSGVIADTLDIGGILKATSTALFATDRAGRVGIGTTTPSTDFLLAVHGSLLVSGTSTINGGGLITQGLFSTSSLSFYTQVNPTPRVVINDAGSVGVGTTSPGATLSITGSGIISDTLNIGGILKATSTALFATARDGRVGIGTTTPSTDVMLAVQGSFLVSGTSTINGGGLITQGLFSTSSLAFYTTNTAAPRAVIEFGGNVGIATSGPATTLSTEGSGYFTTGLGVGYATTGSGNLLVNDLAVIKGRVGAFGTTSPYQEVGVAGDVVLGGSVGTSTLSVETTTASRGGCIELRDADGQWVNIYAGKGGATSTTATVIGSGNQFSNGGASVAGLLVIARGRCEGGTD